MTTNSTPPHDYTAFLATKHPRFQPTGFTLPREEVSTRLFPWQREIVCWALGRGRAAIFAECGLGKTIQQLEWAHHVRAHTGGDVLILAPLTVTGQTAREGERFGYAVTVCRDQTDVRPGINITNYEMLSHFQASHFAGVVLDESSILANFTGKTKRALVEAFARTPFRLCCTATPAPNDHMEFGNHADFLGVMPSYEMLTRWFINDTSSTGTYRLKGHAERDFWDWVASWAVALRTPSDLGPGYSDAGYVLPPLRMRHEIVAVDRTVDAGDALFRDPTMSATTLHQEMRRTACERAARVAELVNGNTDTWTVWCNTNYEADALMARIPDAVEVRGSESAARKEEKLLAFLGGQTRVLVTKARICGYGLNLQHCSHAVFMGLSYSFQDFYQATRRLWRFGQPCPVECVVVAADTEGPILAAIERKVRAHARMIDAMTASTAKLARTPDRVLTPYIAAVPMRLPEWLHSYDDSGKRAS